MTGIRFLRETGVLHNLSTETVCLHIAKMGENLAKLVRALFEND